MKKTCGYCKHCCWYDEKGYHVCYKEYTKDNSNLDKILSNDACKNESFRRRSVFSG